jgi:hypoxanthine phosphoribosyltransferase
MTQYTTLFDAATIAGRVRELAAEIDAAYQGIERPLLMVGVLRGSFVFLADLVRAMNTPTEIDFLAASSYGEGRESSGQVRLVTDLREDIAGRDVLLVEDIVDTGRTLKALTELLAERGPKSLRLVSLLDKPSRRIAAVEADFCGFSIDDLYVIGYGLDDAGLHRDLPCVAVVAT